MAEWGNGNGIQASVPQDSNGQKLKVRSTSGAYQESDWRLDIEDATTNRKALHVSGWTTLEENGSPGNTALTVKGKSTFDSVNTQQRTEPIVNVQGRTELVNPVNYQTPEDPQLALKVTGRSDFLRFEANDPIAVRIDGITRLRLGQVGDQDNTCGMLRPVLSQGDDIVQPQLQINANPDDRPHPETNDGPHVRMGWNDGGSPSSGHGNVVAIRPRKLLLGLAPFELFYPDGYRIKAKGSTKIEPENAEDVALHVAGKTWTEKLDAPAAGTLQIGAENANLVTMPTLMSKHNCSDPWSFNKTAICREMCWCAVR